MGASTDLAAGVAALPPTGTRVVVVNVGTPALATLSTASAARFVGEPVLLVNCGADEASRAWFRRIADTLPIDVVDAPVMVHGRLLDVVFEHVGADIVLTLDSDAEIRCAAVVDRCREWLDRFPSMFGAGFTQGPEWFVRDPALPRRQLVAERAWMPFSFFRVSHVRDALRHGVSFAARAQHNEFRPNQRVSRLLALRTGEDCLGPPPAAYSRIPSSIRFRLRGTKLSALRWARTEIYGHHPSIIWWDTGADMFWWNLLERGRLYGGPHYTFARGMVDHVEGATRWLVGGKARHEEADRAARARLAAVIGEVARECPPHRLAPASG